MAKQVTIRVLAKACGLGVSTVSHALRNDGTVARRTCARVQAEAARLGYVPSPLLAALASRKFRSDTRLRHTPLAHLTFLPDEIERGMRAWAANPGFEAEAARLGYRTERVELSEAGSARAVGQRLYATGVAGLLLGHASFKAAYPWEDLGLDRFSVVAVGLHPLEGRVHSIQGSVYGPARRAWEELHKRGCRRIGAALCSHARTVTDDHIRFAAVLEAHDANGVPMKVPIFRGGHADGAGFQRWVRANRPDGVIGFHIGHYQSLAGMGIRVPDHVKFAALHVTREPGDPISGMDQRMETAGAHAARFLDQMIRHREPGLAAEPLTIRVDAMWVEGRTAGPPPKGAGVTFCHPRPASEERSAESPARQPSQPNRPWAAPGLRGRRRRAPRRV